MRAGGKGGGVGRRRGRAARAEWGAENGWKWWRRHGRLELWLQRPEVGDDRQVGPTCRRPEREEGGAAWAGPQGGGTAGEGWADGPTKKKEGKEKKKRKRIFLGLKLHFGDF
uniref:Uncharacterized protein n=1 Tax=Oryza sativa subsp. japonica TaxID=39947 RepID=Q5Z4J2_ORYSJ|nr:hypothetical protein [Oryza sativa Japonica Group]BAD62340.1 hypothetical protein [Oryza sativa Japonica Group]